MTTTIIRDNMPEARCWACVERYMECGASLQSAINLTAHRYTLERAEVERLYRAHCEVIMDERLAAIATKQQREREALAHVG